MMLSRGRTRLKLGLRTLPRLSGSCLIQYSAVCGKKCQQCCVFCAHLAWAKLPWVVVVFTVVVFFITELPHNHLPCSPTFFNFSARKTSTSFMFLSPSNTCFLFLLSLINARIFLTDLSCCFPGSELYLKIFLMLVILPYSFPFKFLCSAL